MLALKLVLVPLLLLLVSMSGKWWGPAVAGWLAGLPLVAGPILFFLALERGPAFAAQASVLAVSAICASEAFNLAYAWVCLRKPWPLAVLAAMAAWMLAALGLAQLPAGVWWAVGAAALAVAAGQQFLPRSHVALVGLPLSIADVVVRMIGGALLTLGVTFAAGALGATWSGLLAVFPLIGIVLSVSSQRAHGPQFVVALLRGMVLGRFSFVAFCLCLVVMLPNQGVIVSFIVATLVSLAVQSATRALAMAKPAAAGSAVAD